MSVIDDLRQFFLPDPTPMRMEKKEPPPRPSRPRRPRPVRYKRPGAITKFAIETAHLPASVAKQIEIDFQRALAFTYVGRADYREVYLAAGISPDQIPEEELEELPGASGIEIPLLGWEVPSLQVRKIAQSWWESVATWSDVSLALEKDFVWTPLLADWGIENLRVVDQHPVTGKRGKFILDAAGNVLETPGQVKDKYPLAGTILDWVQYGEVRPMRRGVKFPAVKRAWLGKIQPYLTRNEVGRDGTLLSYASLYRRIEDAFDTKKFDAVARDRLVNNLWRDFVGFAKEGYTFGIPEKFLNVLKVTEYRELQFEVRDFLETWEKKGFFRNYIWVGFLRFESERRLAVYLTKHPKVYQSLRKILSPLVSPDLADWLLKRGRVLPNRVVGAFLRRLTTQRFPKEVLANLRGALPPDLYREIGRRSLADLKAAFDARGHLAAYTQLENALYVKWRRWFLPGRFVEWAGRNLTKAQQIVVSWLEEQIEAKTWIGRQLDSKIARLAGRRVFVDQALGKKPSVVARAFAKGAAVRKAAARVALSLWRKGFKAAARWLVKIVQGISAAAGEIAGGPLGSAIAAAITTAITFVGGKVVKWVWDKVGGAVKGVVKAIAIGAAAVATIPASVGLAIGGCGCFLLLAPFLLLVFIIAPAFQPGELGGWLGQEPQLVRVEKTVSPSQVAVGPHPLVNYKIIVSNLSDEEEMTAGTLVDEYDVNNFTPSVLGGADNSQAGRLVWTIDSIPPGGKIEKNYDGFINTDADKHVVNNATFTATLGDQNVSDSASAVVFVGTGGEGRPPSGWPTRRGCITQGPKASGPGATHSALEAVDIAPVVQGSPTDADLNVFATHDGTAYVDRNAGYGPYVRVVSSAGFTTVYGHLEEAFAVGDGESVYAGQLLGRVFVGVIGKSSATHLHYEFRGLTMEPPYIPQGGLRRCVGRAGCNFCFGD